MNRTLARLGEEETIWAVVDTLRAWMELYGVPLALYVDWKNLYERRANAKERLRGEEPITQFGRMCAKLGIGIEIIAANSPQAKGRVERIHGTHQDRLVKKLRRKEITSHQQVNVFLENEYLPEHNRRFARPPAKPEDYHRLAPRAAELDQIFRLESPRTMRHGNITIEYRGRELGWREIPAPAKPCEPAVKPTQKLRLPTPKRKWVPAADHPWRKATLRERWSRKRREKR